VNGANLSDDFKDLILRLFSYDPESRMTLEEVRAHPWLQSNSFDHEAVRTELLESLAQKQLAQPLLDSERPMTRPVKVKMNTPRV